MAFSLLFLIISSLLSSPSQATIPSLLPVTTPADSPQTTSQPFLDSPPLPLPEQDSELPGSPGPAPALSPIAAPAVGGSNQPFGGQQQQPSGGLEQDQQQQLEASVSGGGQQQQQQGQLQPSEGALQPIGGVEQGEEQGQGQRQQQEALGFGAVQPLVDNTPFDSGSTSRMMGYCTWFGYVLALLCFVV